MPSRETEMKGTLASIMEGKQQTLSGSEFQQERKRVLGSVGADAELEGNPNEYRVIHVKDKKKNEVYRFCNNVVSNTKYTWWNFVPKNLWEQFSLNMNRYFLIIAILQLFSVLTPVNPLTTWAPLAVIFAVSAVKEAADDLARYEADKVANATPVRVIRDDGVPTIRADEIEVGDLVKVLNDEALPCDLLLIGSSGKDGTCFIQTTNLDGETNYKQRQAPVETRSLTSDSDFFAFKGVVKCAKPNGQLYKFDSRLWTEASPDQNPPLTVPVSISVNQLLQQTTTLRHTDWAVGIAVYTGNETKFGQNKGKPPRKLTKTDLFVNMLSIWIFATQLCLVVIFGIIGELRRTSKGKDAWYLMYGDDTEIEPIIIPLRFLLLNSTMIPISLKITLDLCKLFYAKFINWDMRMIDTDNPDVKLNAHANNTSISENLGQVEFILSDKTGTLTENVMVFKHCTIANTLYLEKECSSDGKLGAAIRDNKPEELNMMKNFVLCNTVVPSQVGSGQMQYKGSSPDEIALVVAAHNCNVDLRGRESDRVEIMVNGEKEEYRVRQELAFTSERKRMSVVVENLQTGQLTLYTKGADEALIKRFVSEDECATTLEHLNNFAAEGLRTLMFGCRDLSAEEFDNWEHAFKMANSALEDRDRKTEQVYDQLERDLILQGGTAIEDKLQDDVSSTIELLRLAKIRFWMLTGDKYSTALQVATACSLRSPDSRLYEICGNTKGEVGEVILRTLKEVVKLPKRHRSTPSASKIESFRASEYEGTEEEIEREICIIIRGSTLEIAIQYHASQFAKLCMMAHAVICCRVAPAQKAELVKLVKGVNRLTLAIGDGGNDVAMIQEAHIGVGIRGKEGLQAARAADYVINQFKNLKELLLTHGRFSYTRTALVAQYSFYKSLAFCIIQIAYGFVSYFSGCSLFNSLCITAYNAVLFVPIVAFIIDQDVPESTVYSHPVLYHHCAKSRHFNYYTFLFWILRAVYHGIAIFIITYLSWGPAQLMGGSKGFEVEYETMGIVAFCGYLWVQAFTMLMELHNISWCNMILVWVFHFGTLVVLYATNLTSGFLATLNTVGAITQAFTDTQFWLVNLLILIVCIIPVYAWQMVEFNYFPKLVDHLRYAFKNNISVPAPRLHEHRRQLTSDERAGDIMIQRRKQLDELALEMEQKDGTADVEMGEDVPEVIEELPSQDNVISEATAGTNVEMVTMSVTTSSSLSSVPVPASATVVAPPSTSPSLPPPSPTMPFLPPTVPTSTATPQPVSPFPPSLPPPVPTTSAPPAATFTLSASLPFSQQPIPPIPASPTSQTALYQPSTPSA